MKDRICRGRSAIFQKVQDIGLHGNIKRAGASSQMINLGQRQGSRHAYALALAA